MFSLSKYLIFSLQLLLVIFLLSLFPLIYVLEYVLSLNILGLTNDHQYRNNQSIIMERRES
jgi:hypothetical protein